MRRAFEIDVAAISFERMLGEAGGDRARLDQRHMDAGAPQLKTQDIGKSLDGEF